MKDIKFRAFDRKSKQMHYNVGQSFEDATLGWGHMDSASPRYLYTNRLEIMQYIGIKDIDGKDIYEGDVITLHNYNCTTHYNKWNYEVYYNCNEARYKLRNNQDYPNNIDMDTTANTDFAIVGNIYENPELLKERR